MNKLSRKDIAMLEVLAVTEESKGKLAEYIQQREKAVKAYKVFREAVVSGVEVDEVEKVVESKRKFKAGDKVRVLDVSFDMATSALDVGDITKVVGYKEDFGEYELLAPKERPVVVAEPEGETGLFDESVLELVEGKTPNELRAEVIQRAKEFIENTKLKEFTGRVQTGTGLPEEGQRKTLYDVYVFGSGPKKVCDVGFIVNQEKHTVVALMRGKVTKKVYSKGIAKCHPDDVFNADIGKAIALGRALGKDVSDFENAVQPDEVVVGHVVNGDEARGIYTQERKFTLTSKRGRDAFYYAEGEDGCTGVEDDFIYNWQIGDIIDDTNAIYKEDSK